jgi:heme oxygenase
MKTQLWYDTRDLHHACEKHEVGAAMATGSPPMQWYCDWLNALLIIHQHIDPFSIKEIGRVNRLERDILELVQPNDSYAANKYIESLKTKEDILGATYVLLGAHLMGGEVMRRRLVGYPTSHLEWDDRKIALEELTKIKQEENLSTPARKCFQALLQVMDEIKEK